MEKLLMTKKEFKEIMQVLPKAANGKDYTKPILQGVYFYQDKVVALDGYRMCIRQLNKKLETECIINANDFKYTLKHLNAEVKNIEMDFLEDKVIFKLLGKENKVLGELHCKYMCGQYINYKSLLPTKFNGIAIIDNTKEILDLVKGIKKNKPIFIEIENNTMYLYKTETKEHYNKEYKNNIEHKIHLSLLGTVNVENKGDNMKFMINVTYLKDAIKNYNIFQLGYIAKYSPIVIVDNNAKMYDLVLPMRICGELIKE